MEHAPALYALIKLHADLGYQIKENARQATKLRESMKHVEAVLKMLQPGFDTRRIAVKRRNNANPLFKRGTVFRAVLGVLREAQAPMTTDEISLALYRSKGVQEPSRDQMRHMFGAANTTLRGNQGKSVAATMERPRRWQLRASQPLEPKL